MDYYNILNVNKNSSKEEIKKNYRKLAKLYHPDKNGGEDSKFKEISIAYNVLIDDEKKKKYDMKFDINDLTDSLKQFHFFSQKIFQKRNTINNVSIPNILKEFLQVNRQKRKYTILVSFMDVYKNIVKKIKIENKNYFIPLYKREYTIDNITFFINIKTHKNYDIIGDYDIEYNYSISLYESLFNKTLYITNPNNDTLKVNFKHNLLNKKELIIKNQGLPMNENGNKRGDMYINIDIELPKNIDKDYFKNNFPPLSKNNLNCNNYFIVNAE